MERTAHASDAGSPARKRSPLQEWGALSQAVQVDRALHDFAASDPRVTYHECDVSDRAQLQTVLDTIRGSHGPVSGIVLAGEIGAAAGFRKKQPADLERLLAVRVEGTNTLIELTRDDPLEFFVGFGAADGLFGSPLRADAAVAAGMMSQQLGTLDYARPQCRRFTIHWPRWLSAMRDVDELDASLPPGVPSGCISIAEGVEQLIDTLATAGFDRAIYVAGRTDNATEQNSIEPIVRPVEISTEILELVEASPLIDAIVPAPDSAGSGTAYLSFRPTQDPFLTDHRDSLATGPGAAVLPGAVILETYAEAARLFAGGRIPTGVRNLQFLRGFRMTGDLPHRAQIEVEMHDNQAVCRMVGDFYDKQGNRTDPLRLYSTCTVVFDEPAQIPAAVDFDEASVTWQRVVYTELPPDETSTDVWGNTSIFRGPEFMPLEHLGFQQETVWSVLTAAPVGQAGGERRGDGWLTHPVLVDAMLTVGGLSLWSLYKSLQLPADMERLDFGRLPHPFERCTVLAMHRGQSGRYASLDYLVTGENGDLIVACTNGRFVKFERP